MADGPEGFGTGTITRRMVKTRGTGAATKGLMFDARNPAPFKVEKWGPKYKQDMPDPENL